MTENFISSYFFLLFFKIYKKIICFVNKCLKSRGFSTVIVNLILRITSTFEKNKKK